MQYLSNQSFSSVKFVSIMRISSLECSLVTDHEKVIATPSQQDRALGGAWDILDGVLKGPTQAERKEIIRKNHMAYYLKKRKEDELHIEMRLNALQPEGTTP